MIPYARARNALSVLALGASALACGCEAARPAAPAVVTQEASPAGEGSGQPFLSTSGDAVIMSWLQAAPEGGHDLWMARRGPEGWDARRHVAYGDLFFVNWADFPSVVAAPDGTLWAHWLQRGAMGGYDYGIRIAHSRDGGASWSQPWTPHEDGTPTEHGFVTLLPLGDAMGAVWLDGREYAIAPEGAEPPREMTLRFRTLGPGAPGPEVLLDGRTCDCCQTDAAVTSAGPIIAYRGRTEDEVRDVLVTRWVDGGWSEGVPVHRDEWHIGGCPVNGPAIAARGETVAVAWFTGAGDLPKVQVAFSDDGGAGFGAPLRVDDGTPAGRVDLLLLDDGSALVSWLERTGGENAEIRMRRVEPTRVGDAHLVVASSSARGSGFPRMALLDSSALLLAWTDLRPGAPDRVRVARVEVPAR